MLLSGYCQILFCKYIADFKLYTIQYMYFSFRILRCFKGTIWLIYKLYIQVVLYHKTLKFSSMCCFLMNMNIS